jgi:hypothetical protein
MKRKKSGTTKLHFHIRRARKPLIEKEAFSSRDEAIKQAVRSATHGEQFEIEECTGPVCMLVTATEVK